MSTQAKDEMNVPIALSAFRDKCVHTQPQSAASDCGGREVPSIHTQPQSAASDCGGREVPSVHTQPQSGSLLASLTALTRAPRLVSTPVTSLQIQTLLRLALAGRGRRTRVTTRTISGPGSKPPAWPWGLFPDRYLSGMRSDPLAPAQRVPHLNPAFIGVPRLLHRPSLLTGTLLRLPHRLRALC